MPPRRKNARRPLAAISEEAPCEPEAGAPAKPPSESELRRAQVVAELDQQGSPAASWSGAPCRQQPAVQHCPARQALAAAGLPPACERAWVACSGGARPPDTPGRGGRRRGPAPRALRAPDAAAPPGAPGTRRARRPWRAAARPVMPPHEACRARLAPQVRKMPLVEFRSKYGGDVNAVLMQDIDARIAASKACSRVPGSLARLYFPHCSGAAFSCVA